jgi:hypothetical protein
MTKRIGAVFFLVATLFIAGCNQVKPQINLSDQIWNSDDKNVAIALVMPDEPSFYPMGDVRLLDYAIISGAMSELKSHVLTLQQSEFTTVRESLEQAFQAKGYNVVQISEPLDSDKLKSSPQKDTKTEFYTEKDYTSLAQKYGVSKLLLVEVNQSGVARNYHGFIPLDDPHAVISIRGQLIDLSNNQLLWNTNASQTKFTDGNWDEPPAYPGLTESFYVAIEDMKTNLMDVFAGR